MSPEQQRGEEVDARSDIYSVGVLLCELTTGTATPGVRAPIELNASMPRAVSDAIVIALANDPEDRFANAEQFRRALDGVFGLAEGQRRLRTLWMATGAIACCCVLITLAAILPPRKPTNADSRSTTPVATNQRQRNSLKSTTASKQMESQNQQLEAVRKKQLPISRTTTSDLVKKTSQPAATLAAPEESRISTEASQTEIDNIRESLTGLQGRARSCLAEIDSLRKEVGQLHAKVEDAAARLDTSLRGASLNLDAKDTGAAQRNLEVAKQALEDLEKVCPQR